MGRNTKFTPNLKILLSLYSNNENFGYNPTLKINNSPCGIGTFLYRDKLRISQPLLAELGLLNFISCDQEVYVVLNQGSELFGNAY